MQNQPFDILTLNETRLDNSILDCEVQISGYDIIRRDRNRNGGGVAIYIRESIPYMDRKDLIPDALESICIEIKKPKSKPMLISSWYRPPNSNIDLFQNFEQFLQLAHDENMEIIITGDLNCNFLEQDRSQNTSKLLDLMDIYQLQQHIQSPTRITSLTQTLIDVIFTQIGDNKTLDSGVIELGISDHSLVYLCRKVSLPKEAPKFVFSRQFKHYNANRFREDLNEVINLHTTSNDPNLLWSNWKTMFLNIAEKHAPIRQRRVKCEYKPWLTNEIKKLSYHRDYLKRQSVRLGSTYYNEAYKKCKNNLNKLIKDTKEIYFKTKLSNANNSKESWQAINEFLNKKSKTTNVKQLIVGEQVITGDKNIASCFNQYFSTIGSKLADNIKDSDIDPLSFVTPVEKSFHFRDITNNEVVEALKQIKSKKSPGIDGISTRLLKDASVVVAESLVSIFNLSLQTGIFPDDWKLAKVSPVFKEGTKTDCGNYRPISVISVVAKLFEKLIYNQLRSFMDENTILVEQQSGFRVQHSTETALLSSTNEWLYNMDKGLISGVLFLDLKKAFDTVDHHILISKLQLYGIRGRSLEWFKSYLEERKQICTINGKLSDAREIGCGVPQGSNLGPILFLLYINDLPNCLESTKATLFADDTNLTCEGISPTEIENKLNKDLENVHRWLTANKLTLNKTKTEFMIIGSSYRLALIDESPVITIGDDNIKRVSHKKSLGIILDEHLKWNKHNDAQCKKISGNIALLRRAKLFVPQDALIKMYNAFVLPHFNYGSTIWNDGCSTHINKLSKLQRRAARVITGETYAVRSTQILENLGWTSIDEALKKRETLMTFKALTGRSPNYLTELFTTCENDNYHLRSNNTKLSLLKPKTNFLNRSFSYRAAKAWNELPCEITDSFRNLSVLSLKWRMKNAII